MFAQVAESHSPFSQTREKEWGSLKASQYVTSPGSALASGQGETGYPEISGIAGVRTPPRSHQASGWLLGAEGILTAYTAETPPAIRYAVSWLVLGSTAHHRRLPLASEPHSRIFLGEQRGQEALSWIRVIRDLVERDLILDARETLEKVPAYAFASEELQRLRTVLAPPTAKRIDFRGVSRRAEFEWLRAHGHEHRGKWVAVLGDRLVASADSLKALREELARLQLLGRSLIHQIPGGGHAEP